MKAFFKLLISDLKQFFRDKTALFFAFAFPIFYMLIFGWIFSGASITYTVGLVDEDHSSVSNIIAQSLEAIPMFKIVQGPLDSQMEDLKNGKLKALIALPQGMSSSLGNGQVSNVKVYYDPSQTTSSPIILSVMREAVNSINQQLSQRPTLLTLDTESVQTLDLRDIDYLVPGVLAMSILFLGLFGALVQVERREKKVLKRFGATPLKSYTIITSQVVYRLILALIQTMLIVLIAHFVFDVQMIGNWLVLIGVVIMGALTFISLGYLAVSRARTAESAMPIIQLIQFPMLFLSGIFFPVDMMPAFMKPVMAAMPLTYLGDALRQIMVGATPLYPLYIDVAVLGAWLIVCMLLASWLFKWE
jgi:ABC-2 type transport system permease protein